VWLEVRGSRTGEGGSAPRVAAIRDEFLVDPKTLTDHLRFLEERGIVERISCPETPLRVEYI
jgi:DNA-binding HxlR family transcriptional regulator